MSHVKSKLPAPHKKPLSADQLLTLCRWRHCDPTIRPSRLPVMMAQLDALQFVVEGYVPQ